MSVQPDDTASADLKKLQRAEQALRDRDRATARQLLNEVIAHTPTDYRHIEEEGHDLVVHSWDMTEFMLFVGPQKEDLKKYEHVLWQPNVYPRAYFLLGYLAMDENDLRAAERYLLQALRLESDQPKILIELGAVYAALELPDRAVLMYDAALSARPHMLRDEQAAALRGKGIRLIDLGRLDEAEVCLRESLKHDPNNRLAHQEIKYIAELREATLPDP